MQARGTLDTKLFSDISGEFEKDFQSIQYQENFIEEPGQAELERLCRRLAMFLVPESNFLRFSLGLTTCARDDSGNRVWLGRIVCGKDAKELVFFVRISWRQS